MKALAAFCTTLVSISLFNIVSAKFIQSDDSMTLPALEYANIGNGIPVCKSHSSLNSMVIFKISGAISKYHGLGSFEDRNLIARNPPTGKTLLASETVSVHCGNSVHGVLVKYILEDTAAPSGNEYIYRVHMIPTKYAQPGGPGFNLIDFDPDLVDFATAESVNLTGLVGLENLDIFFTLEINQVDQAALISTYSYTSTYITLTNTYQVNANHGQSSTHIKVGEVSKTILIYTPGSTEMHIFNFDGSGVVIYSKKVDILTDMYLTDYVVSKAEFAIPPQRIDLQINYDHMVMTLTHTNDSILTLYVHLDQSGFLSKTQLDLNITSPNFDLFQLGNQPVLAALISIESTTTATWHYHLSIIAFNSSKIALLAESDTFSTFPSTVPHKFHISATQTTPNTTSIAIKHIDDAATWQYSFTQTHMPDDACLLVDVESRCLACRADMWLYMHRCFDGLSVPRGVVRAGAYLVDCLVGNCDDCLADVGGCTQCRTTGATPFYLFENATSVMCMNQAQVNELSGYGVNKISSKVEQCLDTNCQSCFMNTSLCTHCKSGYFLISNTNNCTLTSSILTGYGIIVDSIIPTISRCKASISCTNCSDDHSVCSECEVNSTLIMLTTDPTSTGCTHETISTIRAGYGLKPETIPTIFIECQVDSCLVCSKNSSSCETCSNSNQYLGTISDQSIQCFNDIQIPSGFGISSPTAFSKCLDPSCSDCQANINICVQCGLDNNGNQTVYYLNSTTATNTCISLDMTTAGIGLTASNSSVAETCRVVGCQSCHIDSSDCLACVDGRYVNDTTTGMPKSCIDVQSMPSGFGVNGDAVAQCQVAGCVDCRTDYQICHECIQMKYLHKDVQGDPGTCLALEDIPANYGIVDGIKTTLACSDQACQVCNLDASSCQDCQQNFTANPMYKQPMTRVSTSGSMYTVFKCVFISQAFSGYGLPNGTYTGNSILAPCADSNCIECTTNSSACIECAPGKLLDFLGMSFGDQIVCILPADINPGTGRVISTNHVNKCTESNSCEHCFMDNAKCEKCKSGSVAPYLIITLQICSDGSTETVGLGINSAESTILPCLDLRCQNCHLNYSECTKCDNNSWLHTVLGEMPSCKLEIEIGAIKDAENRSYGKELRDVTQKLSFCPNNCSSCIQDSSKCTICDTGYLLINETSCLQESLDPPLGFGPNSLTGAKKLLKCSISGCQDCSTLYSDCSMCQTGLWLYALATKSCLDLSNIPSGYGKDLTSTIPTLKPCCLSNCKNCIENRMVCSGCSQGFYFYAVSTHQECLTAETIPLGWGVDTYSTYSQILKPCNVPLCISCKFDYSICSACRENHWLNSSEHPQKCLEGKEIPLRKGKNSTSPVLANCTQSLCTNCSQNYSSCQACDKGYRLANGFCFSCLVEGCADCSLGALSCSECRSPGYPYYSLDMSNSSRTCYLTVPYGFGIDKFVNNGNVKRCNSSGGCLSCSSDYLKCEKCTQGLILHKTLQTCVTTIPIGYGLNLSSPILQAVPCSVANCRNCSHNHTNCMNCTEESSASKQYLYQQSSGSQSCLPNHLMPQGLGPNLMIAIVQNCTLDHCIDCSTNYTQCRSCNNGFRLFKTNDFNTSCLPMTLTDIPIGYGIDTSSSTLIQACSDRRCLNCSADYEKCQECVLEYLLYPAFTDTDKLSIASTCVAFDQIIPGVGMDSSLSQILIPCTDSNCQNCDKINASRCLVCTSSSYFYSAQDGAKICLGEDINSLDDHSGFGLNGTNSLELVACSSLCNICDTDYQKCTECMVKHPTTNETVYLNSAGDSCLLHSDMPAGEGPSIAAGNDTSNLISAIQLRSCETPNCDACRTSYTVCTRCQASLYVHIDTATQSISCLRVDQIPAGYGHALGYSVDKVMPCSIDGCADCLTDNLRCRSCEGGYRYLFDTSSNETIRCLANSYLLHTGMMAKGISFGPELIDSLKLVPCIDNCYSCSQIWNKCQMCDRGYLLKTDNLACLPDIESSYSAGEGKSVNPEMVEVIVPCIDPLCLDCRKDAEFCSVCKSTDLLGNKVYELWLPDHDQTCFIKDDLPLGFGPVLGTQYAKLCSNRLCSNCSDDYMICKKCSSTAFFSLNDDNSVTCYGVNTTGFVGPYGKNGTNKQLAKCSIDNCSSCAEDYQTCSGCSDTFILDTRDGICIPYTTKRLGWGLDYANPEYPKFLPCAIQNCIDCHTSATQACTECNRGMFIKRTRGPECVNKLPEGYGPLSLVSQEVKICLDHCESCSSVYSVCDTCKMGFTLSQGKCLVLRIASGYGLNPGSGSVTRCSDSNCLECKSNTQKCYRCGHNYVADLVTGKCYSISKPEDIPFYFGVDGFYLSPCQMENCQICSTSYMDCERCRQGYSLMIVNGVLFCQNKNTSINETLVNSIKNEGVKDISYDAGDQAALLTFKDTIPNLDYSRSLELTAYNKDSSPLLGINLSKAELKASMRDIYFTFSSDDNLKDATVLLRSKSASSTVISSRILIENTNPFDLGIKLSNVAIYKTQRLEIARVLSIICTSILCLFTVLGFAMGRYYGFRILYYHTLLASLAFTSVQKPVYWKSFLSMLRWTVVSFIPLPTADTTDIKCSVQGSIYFSGYHCFVYDNLRYYLVIFVLIAAFKVFTRCFTSSISGKRNTYNSDIAWRKKVVLLDTLINVNFFMRYFQAVMPFWMYFALLNLFYAAPSRLMALGMTMATLIILLYLFWIVIGSISALAAEANDRISFMDHIRFAAFSQLAKGNRIISLTHIVDMIKTWIYCMALVFGQGNPKVQLGICIAAFLGNCLFLATTRPFHHGLNTVLVLLIDAIFAILLSMDLVLAINYESLSQTVIEEQFLSGYIICSVVIIAVLIIWLICLAVLRKKMVLDEENTSMTRKHVQLSSANANFSKVPNKVSGDTSTKNDLNMLVGKSQILKRDPKLEPRGMIGNETNHGGIDANDKIRPRSFENLPEPVTTAMFGISHSRKVTAEKNKTNLPRDMFKRVTFNNNGPVDDFREVRTSKFEPLPTLNNIKKRPFLVAPLEKQDEKLRDQENPNHEKKAKIRLNTFASSEARLKDGKKSKSGISQFALPSKRKQDNQVTDIDRLPIDGLDVTSKSKVLPFLRKRFDR